MSNRKKEPDTVSSTVQGEQSQKGKKSKKNSSKNPKQDISKIIPVQDGMKQMGRVSSPKSSPQREFYLSSNSKEFPQLVRKDHESSQFEKSWGPQISCKGNGIDFGKTFSEVPSVDKSKKESDNSLSQENERDETSCKQENPVVDKTDGSSKSKNDKKVKPDNSAKPIQPMEKTQTQRNPIKKKRADPVLINLNEILEVNKAHRKIKQHKTVKCKRIDDTEKLSGNILDSSNPKRNKGKHREVKRKKLTNLKLVILKERIIKQKLRESQADGNLETLYTDWIENIDFKEEIKKYLADLEEKKIKMKQGCKDKGKQNIPTDVKVEELEEKLTESKDKHQKVGCLMEKNKCALEKSYVKSVSKTDEENETFFSCKVREYCDNIITVALNSAVIELIREVVCLQDKLFARDPVKARAKKRHVSGFREVKKFLNLKKVKMIVIPPNLEKLQMKGSVFDLISELKEMANIQNVPYVFALDRYKLGKCAKKNVPIAAFAILNYEGLEDRFRNVLTHLQEARQLFEDVMSKTRVKVEGKDSGKSEQQTGDTVLKTIIKDKNEFKDDSSDDEVVSQTISSFLSSLRELSAKK